MKKFLSMVLTLVMLCTIVLSTTAYADTGGSGNLDGGGGGMGSGTSNNVWNPGNEGVRVTVVRASDHAVVTTPFDFSSKPPSTGIYHFGSISKIQYNNGLGLSPQNGGYLCIKPAQAMPRIISTNGSNNIEAIKKYFCSEYVVKRIAEITGMKYDVLIGGEYKILLEPVAYYKFEGSMFATTATEAALYDEQTSGLLRKRMGSLTHQNLPLAMFLETSDLGYPAWSGATSGKRTNTEIKSSLGLGIVRFTEKPEAPEVTAFDYTYRVNTEVITTANVSGGQSDPDNPTRVSFNIGGTTYNVGNVYYPSGDSQLAWVRWRTPSTPQVIEIRVTASGSGSSQGIIRCNIVSLDENPPPNPVADDRNDSFRIPAEPRETPKTTGQWTVWRPWWQEYWVWHSTGKNSGYWCDHGWWEFDLDRYRADLRTDMSIKCDDKNPTASGRTMKSGYGINQTVNASVSTNQSSATTPVQTGVTYFPEFGYQTYWRLLDASISGNSTVFQFQKNKFSTYHGRTHFSPIWYPDGPYAPYTVVMDCWTPDGMLTQNECDELTIRGNLWQDWHAGPLDPNR